MKKDKIKKDYRLLIENILNNNLIDANDILSKLVTEAEKQREEDIANLIIEQEDDVEEVDDTEDAGEEDAEGGEEEGAEPDDNDTDLGDDLEDAAGEEADETDEDNVVGNATLTELGNDEVELVCQINEKMISKFVDKLANLKTKLLAMDLEKDSREYVTLDTTISYYSKKLRELQDKCEVTVDQNEVADRLKIIEEAIKKLEQQLSGSADETDGVPNVKSTDELEEGEEAEEATDEEGEESEEEGEEEEEPESEEEEEGEEDTEE